MPASESPWNGLRGARAAAGATLAYALLTLVMTWPLATGLARVLPSDHGDNLLNAWILGWGAESLVGMLTGASSFHDWWNAPIFHPSPLALAYSEHLFALVVQVLPVYLATDNLILGYNLLFLSTFVLSGLGTYLLVTDLTGSRAAGFVAGLFYAFVPYRINQLSHLQILSSQWMPFALYGFRRYLATRRWQPLAGGSAALVMQNLSCGYYLLFFAPIVPAFVLAEMIGRGRLRDRRVWLSLTGAAAVVGACTLPFLLPYTELRALDGFERSIHEIRGFSPDLYGYLTAPSALWFWGSRLQLAPKAEGDLFLGAVPMLLGLAALGLAVAEARRAAATGAEELRGRWLIRGLLALAALAALALVVLTVSGPVRGSVFGLSLRMTDGGRPLLLLAGAGAALIALSARVRTGARAFLGAPGVMAWAFLLFAVAMSLGPTPMRGGERLVGLEIYAWFVDHVPGFDGLRVPGRYAMIAALFLAMAAGAPLAWLARRGRAGLVAVGVLGALFLVEAAAMPIEINRLWGSGAYRDAPVVRPGPEAPPVYQHLAGLPRDRVVLEMPLGDAGWDLRAVYYASVHRLPLVNGYSGGFPEGYAQRMVTLAYLPTDPAPAWASILASGATHIVVHKQAYWGDRIERVRGFLDANGAVLEHDFGDDLLYRVDR